METEWEATFWPIDKDDVRRRLGEAGATLIYPERLMRRVNFFPPAEILHGWVRVRDEGDKITLSMKQSGARIEEQQEAQVVITDFDAGLALLESLGCKRKNYQETRRELWHYMDTEVTIDEWPWLAPLVEIEGRSEEAVRKAAEGLGFSWDEALFASIDKLYAKHYGVEPRDVSNLPRLVFDGDNPLIPLSGKHEEELL